MTNITIPEDLKEMIKEIVAYEEFNEELDQEIEEWAREWLYITPPVPEPCPAIENIDEEETWKIEIRV